MSNSAQSKKYDHRQIDRQIDRQVDRQMDRQTDIDIDVQIYIYIYRYKYIQIDINNICIHLCSLHDSSMKLIKTAKPRKNHLNHYYYSVFHKPCELKSVIVF